MKAASALVYQPDTETFLLVKRAETKEVNPEKWEFPGGYVEEDETEKQAALRELKEETGLNGQIIRTGKTGKIETPRGTLELTPFLIVVDETDVELSREHSEYEWVKKEDIDSFDTVRGIERELKSVGIETQ